MSSSKKSRRGHHEEEHENHERWAVSYADMVTVLMSLFIVLFAISQVDQQKYVELARGLAQGFGTSHTAPMTGNNSVVEGEIGEPQPVQLDNSAAPSPVTMSSLDTELAKLDQARAKATTENNVRLAEAELERLIAIKAKLEGALASKGLADRVKFRITERGLVAAVVADDVFFANASAQMQLAGSNTLDVLAPALAGLPESIAVEGHTNHLPLRGGPYRDNWELSAARASTVVSYLIQSKRLAPDRMMVTGYADTRPLYAKDDPRAVVGNRRVDLVVLDQQPIHVRALIPQLASARGIASSDPAQPAAQNGHN